MKDIYLGSLILLLVVFSAGIGFILGDAWRGCRDAELARKNAPPGFKGAGGAETDGR